jgi:hypothetical protein
VTDARRPVGLARHEDGGCRVCRHPQREAIEAEFVRWKTLREIEAEFNVPKDSVARHARARGLEERRSRNVRGVLVRVVEKGIETAEVTSAALVAAATALAKMGEDGRLTDRIEISGHMVGLLPKDKRAAASRRASQVCIAVGKRGADRPNDSRHRLLVNGLPENSAARCSPAG